MFEYSFGAAVNHHRQSFVDAKVADLEYPFVDLDTGKPLNPGEYLLTDKPMTAAGETGGEETRRVTPDFRKNIVCFYARMKSPDQARNRAVACSLAETPSQLE